jgi:hypothetical protein
MNLLYMLFVTLSTTLWIFLDLPFRLIPPLPLCASHGPIGYRHPSGTHRREIILARSAVVALIAGSHFAAFSGSASAFGAGWIISHGFVIMFSLIVYAFC